LILPAHLALHNPAEKRSTFWCGFGKEGQFLRNCGLNEVARADSYLVESLAALRKLVEVEILRASRVAPPIDDSRWDLANSWMMKNLSIHAPVPALCDYLRMSPSTLHRFFRKHADMAPGAYFRDLKMNEARRLIRDLGWQVKATAYHLGYRHPNELSRTLAGRTSGK
jgi:AraC-like DNA-binding protein